MLNKIAASAQKHRAASPDKRNFKYMKNDKLRVCLLNDSFPPLIDGVSTAVVNYAANLQKKGCGVVVGTPQYPDVTDEYPYPVVRYPSLDTMKLLGYRTGYPFSLASLRELEGEGLDIIHSHCPMSSTLVARALREGAGAPVVFTYHTKFDIDIARAIEVRWLRAPAIKAMVSNISACDEVWVVSSGAGENLRKLGYQGDYTVMENGVDFPRGRASKEEVAALRETRGLAPGEPVLLFVGRLLWYKGIRMILDGLSFLRAGGRRFRMVFVGDGPDREEIERYAAEKGLSDVCCFTGAIHDRELLRVYFSLCELFLFPSTFDTNGIVVREAAACGAPSLLIRGSCAAEGIEDGRTGLLCEENAGSLAEAAAAALERREELREIGQHAMEELYLSWETAVDRAQTRYGRIVEQYRSRPEQFRAERPGDLFDLTIEMTQVLRRVEEAGVRLRNVYRREFEE